MLVKKQNQWYYVLLILLIFFLANLLNAQNPVNVSQIKVSIKPVLDGSEYSNLYGEIGNYFINVLKSKNVSVADDAQYELAISVKELSEENEIIISITHNMSLPDYVINLIVEHEAFYKDVSDETKYPKEGKEIRKMITREFIYQYRQAVDNNIIITNKTDLQKDCERFINSYIKKITKYQKRS